MAEGPEVRRKAAQLRELLVGRPLVEVGFTFERLKPFEVLLTGRTVTGVDTFGKAFVLHFDNGLHLYVHPKMFGNWILRKRPGLPKTARKLRAHLRTAVGAALLYSTNDLAVLNDAELDRHPYLTRLGPDVLDPALTEGAVRARLEDERFNAMRLSALLLDQAFLAGIGNYMRSEILFEARLFPLARVGELTGEERTRLARAILGVSRRAFEERGRTLAADIAEKGRREGLRPWDVRHWVFKREGRPCYACGTPIQRHETEGRRYFMCPECQGRGHELPPPVPAPVGKYRPRKGPAVRSTAT